MEASKMHVRCSVNNCHYNDNQYVLCRFSLDVNTQWVTE